MLLQMLLVGQLLFAAGGPTAQQILEKSDRARGGLSQGLSWDLKMDSVDDGENQNSEYKVKVKSANALAECVAPARQKGESILFNDRNMWINKPGLKKPVSVSPRQRLSGQAANGDIATTNYARDYDATIAGEDSVQGQKAYRLNLVAKAKNVTYDKITYWVSKDKMLAIKADFLTLDGKAFKSAEFKYDNNIVSGGKKEPFVSEMKITDSKMSQNVTTIKYSNPKAENISDTTFNINNISH